MRNKKKKSITIENLAGMVQRGFTVGEKKAEERFRKLEGSSKRLEGSVKRLEESNKEIWYKLDSMERRIVFLEDKITEYSKILAEHSKELKEIKTLIQKYQKDRETDQEKIISLEKRVQNLEVKVFA